MPQKVEITITHEWFCNGKPIEKADPETAKLLRDFLANETRQYFWIVTSVTPERTLLKLTVLRRVDLFFNDEPILRLENVELSGHSHYTYVLP